MEKICLELNKIDMSFTDELVFTIDRLAVHQFDRIGIVGKNGAGKSTLLQLIHGDIPVQEKGSIRRHITFAYFDQLLPPTEEEPDYALLGKMTVTHDHQERYSGGEQTKYKISQLFSTYHEGMLLDEPTSHLDQDGIQHLIEELTYYYGALLLVSHDRHLLDTLVTKIWEIENGKITEYTGNYTDYLAQKELERQQQEEQYEQFSKEKNRLMQAAEEKKKKAVKVTEANKRLSKRGTKDIPNKSFMTKAKDTSQKGIQRAAKAIEQRIDQLEEVTAPLAQKTLKFHQPAHLALHNKFPVMASSLTLHAGEKLLLDQAQFQFPLGKTIAITGKNGTGKSTLLQHIYKHGDGLDISPKAKFGYYGQMTYQSLKSQTILQQLQKASDKPESIIRAALQTMDFQAQDVSKNVRELSGGERIRLILCELFLGKYNILLLDEPTNFLDIYCLDALERFCHAYEGTIILVTHDQQFIDHTADVVYQIENQQLKQIKTD